MNCICCGKEVEPYKSNAYKGQVRRVCPDCKRAETVAKSFEKRTGTPCNIKRIKYLLDQNECTYCHYILNFATKHIDHITPVSKGGTNADDNLCISCSYCNEQKSDMTGDEYRKFLDEHPEELQKRNFNFARKILGKTLVTRTIKVKKQKTWDEGIAEGIITKNAKGKYIVDRNAEYTYEVEETVTEKVFILDELAKGNYIEPEVINSNIMELSNQN